MLTGIVPTVFQLLRGPYWNIKGTAMGDVTPGDWLPHKHGREDLRNEEWLVVACGYDTGDIDANICAVNSRDGADAHLLAASKDLLAALTVATKWIVDLAESGDAGFWDAEKMPEVIQARTAISKALGISSTLQMKEAA
jgi:hypothetical protein